MGNPAGNRPVSGIDGPFGWIDASISMSEKEVPIHMEDGQILWTPTELLVKQEDGSYFLPISTGQAQEIDASKGMHMVIPVIKERAVVDRTHKVTGRVRVTKHVREHEEVVDEPGYKEIVEVEHVPINQVVDQPPAARREGDTLVIPVLEEVLVVEKRLVLKEEVRIRKRREEVRNPQRISLRSEEVGVERIDLDQTIE